MSQHHKSIFGRYNSNSQESKKLAENSLAKIAQLGLNANPIHFTLIFEWLNQNDPFLFEQIEQAINDNQYNNITAESLYTNLIGQLLYDSIPAQEVSNLLNNLQDHLNQWVINGKEKQGRLQSNIQTLVKMDLPDNVKTPLVTEIAPTIDELISETSILREEVQKATQEILLLKKELERTSSIGKIDELTDIANWNGFNDILNESVQQANSKQASFALILIDLDHFTDINNDFGYLIGDSVLRYIAKLIGNEVGDKGSFARYDGQQFAIILPECYYDTAMHIADSIRHKISSRPLQIKSSHKKLQLSLSAGVSLYQLGENVENLINRVSQQLTEAKTSGRNRVNGNN
ncbi:MAG: GGDEF domain-containing protein [Pseudomonadota bacterium]|nr:GGDEF domain-containing protein [Pseudomonadota bacterium]